MVQEIEWNTQSTESDIPGRATIIFSDEVFFRGIDYSLTFPSGEVSIPFRLIDPTSRKTFIHPDNLPALFTVRSKSGKEYLVKIDQSNYSLVADDINFLTPEFPEEVTTITLDLTPSDAKAKINDIFLSGPFPKTFSVDAGDYNLVISKDGYETLELGIRILEGQDNKWTFTLNKIPVEEPPIEEPSIWDRIKDGILNTLDKVESFLQNPPIPEFWNRWDDLIDRTYDKLGIPEESILRYKTDMDPNTPFKWLFFSPMMATGTTGEVIVELFPTASQSEINNIVSKYGSEQTTKALADYMLANPIKAGEQWLLVPKDIKNLVGGELLKSPAGREVFFTLNVNGAGASPLKGGILTAAKKSPSWFKVIVGGLAGYLTFANFLAWSGKEALVETLSFPIWTLIDNEDWQGVLDHLGALRNSIDAADNAMILTKPIPIVRNIWSGYIDNAKTQADIYEKLATDALAGEIVTGHLIIIPTPSDSKVSVQGQIPTTGIFEETLPIGIYSITVSKFGFNSETQDVEVLHLITNEVFIDLEESPIPTPEKGIINISSLPEGAEIKIEGQEIKNTPASYSLDAGTYDIVINKEGFQGESRRVFLEAGETEIVSVTLKEIEKALGRITINSLPTGASIFIDGKFQFTTTPFTAEQETGAHIVRLELDGFNPLEKELLWEKGIDKSETIDLTESEIIIEPGVANAWKYNIKAFNTDTGGELVAKVFVDGIDQKLITPTSIFLLPESTYNLQLTKFGFEPANILIETEPLP